MGYVVKISPVGTTILKVVNIVVNFFYKVQPNHNPKIKYKLANNNFTFVKTLI